MLSNKPSFSRSPSPKGHPQGVSPSAGKDSNRGTAIFCHHCGKQIVWNVTYPDKSNSHWAHAILVHHGKAHDIGNALMEQQCADKRHWATPRRQQRLTPAGLLRTFISAWEDDIDNDKDINGGDAVEFLTGFYQDCQKVLEAGDTEADLVAACRGLLKLVAPNIERTIAEANGDLNVLQSDCRRAYEALQKAGVKL